MEDMILVGFGGHARSVADCIKREGKFRIVGYTEREAVLENTQYRYLGNDDVLQEYYDRGIQNAFICVGYLGEGNVRDSLYEKLSGIGFNFPVVIDPSAVVSEDAGIGEGTFIGKNAVVNAGVSIGKQCIINTGAVVEHEGVVKEFSHVAVAAVLCGNANVEDHCFVGANATVIQGIQIHSHAVIGAGSIILSDVPAHKRVYGIWKTI